MYPLHWAVSRFNPCIQILKKLVLLHPGATQIFDKEGMRPIDRFLFHDARTNAKSSLREVETAAMKQREDIYSLLLHADVFVAEQKRIEEEDEKRWIEEGDGEDLDLLSQQAY